jgi:acyl dehydratase
MTDSVDLSHIGRAGAPFIVEVEKGAIRRFAEAIKDKNPLYHDEDYARARGFRSIVAPPTFPATFRPPQRQPWLKDLDYARLLAGEQSFEFRRPIAAGDVLTCRLHLIDVEEKQGRSGRMQRIIQDLNCIDEGGELVATNRRVAMYRLLPEEGK